jgi:hypothetical protein
MSGYSLLLIIRLALKYHPLLKQLVKDRNIAVEINPISNQVLVRK